MKDEELLKICTEFGLELEKKLGDMSDFSEVEIMFMYFKGGFQYASRHLTKDAADFRKARGVLKDFGIDPVADIRKLRGG